MFVMTCSSALTGVSGTPDTDITYVTLSVASLSFINLTWALGFLPDACGGKIIKHTDSLSHSVSFRHQMCFHTQTTQIQMEMLYY